ncbi:His-Xaa-Ser system radical SAM maturase HxsB [Pseudomonas schmalbachii]|uniref:His-Xaa-Ser system radical SAM maturase HxsB n=1 Tax=Pseudomonas schmalbachii TaxID=2816993 RepID=A0ABS3TRF1_9PSED|nr:His-Xaa-Ser system radical SAM maturase HxsB [Pseudomonas schmalbachii]MBO3276247.1 His-Xaa-Ser system radical SAM maturase HxsB [Pseudomonas schmalbachii]
MSKFHGIGAYAPTHSYELLPFKFDRLNDKEYLLTNMVGEFLVIPEALLGDIVGHTLPLTSDWLPDLRAKQFLRFPEEQAPLELLALKLRTRMSRLAQFTNLHIFVVTLRCDHSCPYCQVSRQSEDKAAFDMTPEMADRALDFVFRSPNPAIKIEFQGGEPLLNFEMVKYVVTQAKERNRTEGRNLQFVIATTLSLLTDEMLAFCKEHQISLSSSLDGPADLHNANRPRPGRDSHQRFEEGLQRARAALGFDYVSALMTTTEKSLPRVREIIDEYLRLGFDGIFLRPLSPYGFAIKTKRFMAYDAARYLEFYKEGLQYIIELNKAGIRFSEYYSSLVLAKMLTSNDPGFVDLMNPSGAGIAAIVFNYDGTVYASDESRMLAEMGDPAFRLGNLLEQSYEEIILSDNLLDALEDSFTLSVPMCADCAFEPYCGAEPVYHHAVHKDVVGRKPESGFCSRNMGIFKHLIGLLRSDPETRQILTGWANRC